eukprot:3705502-Prymnesium_polylepis.1
MAGVLFAPVWLQARREQGLCGCARLRAQLRPADRAPIGEDGLQGEPPTPRTLSLARRRFARPPRRRRDAPPPPRCTAAAMP